MQTITVALGSAPGQRSYPIHIGEGILSQPELFLERLPQKRVAIVSNTTVAPLYMETLRSALDSQRTGIPAWGAQVGDPFAPPASPA